MIFRRDHPADRIALRVPVITLVLAATAIPVELRLPSHDGWTFSFFSFDVLLNVLGYIPVGIVLGELGPFRAVTTATVIAMFAETVQLTMMHRDPSITDVLSNLVGAGLGVSISSHWRLRSPEFFVNKVTSSIAALLAVMVGIGVWMTSGDALNTRGLSSPGTLEAFWKLDESSGRVAEDSSGKELHGWFNKEPNRVGGIAGRAVRLDGAHDNIDFGHSSPLRLAGSMTISAWIKSTFYPVDDAAIVSSHNVSTMVTGYQLDTTIDRGPRTIGFKIANECGQLTARYGSTPLIAGSWYHVAGVYDADKRTMDVYLNGQPDNGFLLGSVTGAQHASRSHVYVGRRSDSAAFEFAGFIDEVRIYSRALTNAEIVSDMRGRVIDGPRPRVPLERMVVVTLRALSHRTQRMPKSQRPLLGSEYSWRSRASAIGRPQRG